VNEVHFSQSDIGKVAKMFPGFDIVPSEMKKGVLMRMGTDLIVFGEIDGESIDVGNIIDCFVKFERIVVVSIALPSFVAVDKIKWRCITSLRQILSAILPFLLEMATVDQN
jgi:hypothetical protein